MSSQRRHTRHNSPDAGSVDHVDSAGTTLLGSPGSAAGRESWESGKDGRYAEIELERLDHRRKNADEGEWRDDDDDDEIGDDEHDRLLLPDTTHTAKHSSDSPPPSTPPAPDKPVTWAQLPKKDQLILLTLARLSEPLAQTSLQSYMFYQLKSFRLPDGTAPSDGTVARQAGMLAAAFTGAQFCTAMLWGRIADSERMGRKRVILVGLMGTAVMMLGFGFAESFAVAFFWRCLGGLLNGNVPVIRTIVSEIVREKRFQSRAFLVLPITFNIGVILGPLLGGLLADPVASYPGIFGPGGSLGGEHGVRWMMRWPYALPNVVTATFLGISTLALMFGLDETLEGLRDRPDFGVRVRKWVVKTVFGGRWQHESGDYVPVSIEEGSSTAQEVESQRAGKKDKIHRTRPKLPIRRIWTRNVLFTLLSHGLMNSHTSTFSSLWFIFLSTPRYDPNYNDHTNSTTAALPSAIATNITTEHTTPLQELPPDYHPHLPFTFTGGLALPPASIGSALAILGIIGISLQLFLYPRLSFRLGTVKSLHYSLCLFPLSYTLAPFLSLLPSTSSPPGQATGPLVWIGITLVLAVQVFGRTFALPASAILVNNSSPHPSVLATLHGIAQSFVSALRTAGPVVAGSLYALGLSRGVVGLAWWCMAGVAVVGAVASRFVVDSDGHEIWLEGDKEDEGG